MLLLKEVALSSYPLFDTAGYFYLTRQDINPRAPRIFTTNNAFKNRGIGWSDEIKSYEFFNVMNRFCPCTELQNVTDHQNMSV